MFIFSSLKGLQFTFQSFQSDRGGQSGSRYNKYIHLTFSLMIYSPRILKSRCHTEWKAPTYKPSKPTYLWPPVLWVSTGELFECDHMYN